MNFTANYFERYNSYSAFITENPNPDTNLIVVIPCYRDEFIFKTLDSLFANNITEVNVEIIVVVNFSVDDNENTKQLNRNIYNQLKDYKKTFIDSKIRIYPIIIEDVPKKHAGVGNARKAGMDEAARRFEKINNPFGIIVSLDADTLVHKDYLKETEKSFENNKNQGACLIQFEHDFDASVYEKEVITAAKYYELYLRYFRLALKLTGFPYPYHTIGSCFAVTAETYVKAGGMSRRQGGEDFYFIHKIAPLTKIGVVNKKLVYPSPRVSDRVPFGTGPSVKKIINEKKYMVYNFDAFIRLKEFFGTFDELYAKTNDAIDEIPKIIKDYYGKEKIIEIINECKVNTNSLSNFKKRMFSNFNAFFIIKFLNSLSNHNLLMPEDVLLCSQKLLKYYNFSPENNDIKGIYQNIINLDVLH